ncbi:MAG TPA: XdhC family protein [Candidatus Saccharimonadales bacterium]|nr:XdhC family protein [Candidatus Saccharimonadales bacterium]
MPSIFESLVAAIEQKQPVALALLNGVKGSSPQKKGAKALFFADGRMAGTLGGGCLEAEVRERARLAIETAQPATFELVLDHDFGWDDGLICGGKVSGIILPEVRSGEQVWRRLQQRDIEFCWGIDLEFNVREVKKEESGGWLYQEQIRPPTVLWIAGAGHVAQAVAPLALNLDFAVTVFDDRDSLANHRFFPKETFLRVDAWERMMETELPNAPAFGLIVTRGHQHDALVLRNWAHKTFAFLGMIGSQRKRRLIFERFIEENVATEEELSRVQCPAGLDIQAVTVPEIAVSIVGQLIQKRAALCQR